MSKEAIKEIVKKEITCLRNSNYSVKQENNVFEITPDEDKNVKFLIELKLLKNKISFFYKDKEIEEKNNVIKNCIILTYSDNLFNSWNKLKLDSLEAVSNYMLDNLNIERVPSRFIDYLSDYEYSFFTTTKIYKIDYVSYEISLNSDSELHISHQISSGLMHIELYVNNKRKKHSSFQYNFNGKIIPRQDNIHPDDIISFCFSNIEMNKETNEDLLISNNEFGNNLINDFNLLSSNFTKNEKIYSIDYLVDIVKRYEQIKKDIDSLKSYLSEMSDILEKVKEENNIKSILLDNFKKCEKILLNRKEKFEEFKDFYLEETSKRMNEKLKKVI